MNRRQVYFLLAGVCLCAFSLLFPAWLSEDENTFAVWSAGYHFRYARPAVKLPDEVRPISGPEPTGTAMRVMSIHVDGLREVGQAAALFFLTLGAILVSVHRRLVAVHVVGWVCVFAGVCVLGILIVYVFFLLS